MNDEWEFNFRTFPKKYKAPANCSIIFIFCESVLFFYGLSMAAVFWAEAYASLKQPEVGQAGSALIAGVI